MDEYNVFILDNTKYQERNEETAAQHFTLAVCAAVPGTSNAFCQVTKTKKNICDDEKPISMPYIAEA